MVKKHTHKTFCNFYRVTQKSVLTNLSYWGYMNKNPLDPFAKSQQRAFFCEPLQGYDKTQIIVSNKNGTGSSIVWRFAPGFPCTAAPRSQTKAPHTTCVSVFMFSWLVAERRRAAWWERTSLSSFCQGGGGIEARREGRRGEEGRWNGAHFLSGGDEEFDPETRLNGELLHNYIVPRRFIFIIYCITDSAEFVRLFQSEIQALSGSLLQAYSAYCSCYVTIQNG